VPVVFTLNVVDVLLNLTKVAPVNPVPVSTTLVPGGPLVGVKLLITGAAALAIGAVPTVSNRAHTAVAVHLKVPFIFPPDMPVRLAPGRHIIIV
jgi:hypothetical protein